MPHVEKEDHRRKPVQSAGRYPRAEMCYSYTFKDDGSIRLDECGRQGGLGYQGKITCRMPRTTDLISSRRTFSCDAVIELPPSNLKGYRERLLGDAAQHSPSSPPQLGAEASHQLAVLFSHYYDSRTIASLTVSSGYSKWELHVSLPIKGRGSGPSRIVNVQIEQARIQAALIAVLSYVFSAPPQLTEE